MLTGRLVPRAVALAGIAGLGLLGLTALPAVAAPHHPAAAAQGRPQWLRSNTGATHSPEVLHQLAGVHSAVINGPQAAADASTVPGAPQGIDVSSNQEKQSGGIKWSTIASDGIKFAAIKVTEGAYYTNSYALTDLPAAQAAGLTTVAYAFAIPNGGADGSVHYSASPVVQADDLVNYLASNKLTVPPVMLDIENDPYAGSDGSTGSCYGLSQSAMVSWISGFDAEIQARTGRLPFIYTNPSWWTTCTGGSTAFSQLPVWTASWTTASTPSLPAGWRTWNLWQYTSSGTVKGIAGNVDLDQLNPNVITLLDPGAQQDPAGSALASPLPVTPFTVSPAPALTYTAAGLPPGLTIDSATGQISGTPAQTGRYQATVTATGASGTTGSVSFTWDAYGTITATQPANQSTVAGTPVSLAVQATDSAPGYSPSFTAAGLPPGLSISRSGLITGWPDSPGTYNPTIRAVDGLGSVGTATFSWSVSAAPAAGPAGAIKLKLNGKCLDDSGNQTANGTKIVIWTCNGTAPQRWTVVKDQTIRIHGKCLDVYHSGTASGTKVQLWSCNGNAAENWRVATGGELINPHSNRCLTDPGSSNSNGMQVQIVTCGGHSNQKWTLPAGPVSSGIPGKCLDDSGNRTVNNNKIDIWTCNGTAAQRWTVATDQTIRVHGKCLDVYHSGTASGTKVQLYSCNGTSAQRWSIQASGSGSKLVNPHSGLCLTDPNDSTANGTGLKIMTCAGQPGQAWRAQ